MLCCSANAMLQLQHRLRAFWQESAASLFVQLHPHAQALIGTASHEAPALPRSLAIDISVTFQILRGQRTCGSICGAAMVGWPCGRWARRRGQHGLRRSDRQGRRSGGDSRPTLKTHRLHDRARRHHGVARAEGRARDRRGDAAARAAGRPAGRLPAEPRRRAPEHRQDQRHQPGAQHRGADHGLRLRHDLRHLRGARADALSPHRHALFAQQRSDGAGALCRRDRLGRRHHHLAHRAGRPARPLHDRARLPLRHAWPHRYGHRASRSTISTTTPSPPRRCASWSRSGGGRLALLAPPAASPITTICANGFAEALGEIGASGNSVQHRHRSTIRSTRSASGPRS